MTVATYREALRALEHCWGQHNDDSALKFVVRVEGLPAMPQAPQQVAKELALDFTRAIRVQRGFESARVIVDERSRAVLDSAEAKAAMGEEAS